MAELRADDAATDAAVPREQNALRNNRSRTRNYSGLLTGNKRCRPVMSIDGRRIDVPPDSEIDRETGRDAIVILRKRCVVPRAQMRDIG